MSKAGISLTVYAIYLASAGASIAFIPNVVLPILGLPMTDEVWVRLYGGLAIALAAKGYHGARLNSYTSMQFDVYTRTGFATFLSLLVIIGLCPPILIIFAIIDYAGSLWTQLAIWAEHKKYAPAA
jgi:hypothetical protein